jgi:hypothetical protein
VTTGCRVSGGLPPQGRHSSSRCAPSSRPKAALEPVEKVVTSTSDLAGWLATDFRLELLSPYVDVPSVTWFDGQPGLPRRLVLERHIGEHIRTVLRLGSASIDPKTPLRSLGFDSLLSVELRTRLETSLSVGLDNDFVWTHPTR